MSGAEHAPAPAAPSRPETPASVAPAPDGHASDAAAAPRPGFVQRHAGWLPALILPTATAHQLYIIVAARSADNVSALSWFLFFLANVGALVLTRRETWVDKVQSYLAFALTAALDVLLILAILWFQSQQA